MNQARIVVSYNTTEYGEQTVVLAEQDGHDAYHVDVVDLTPIIDEMKWEADGGIVIRIKPTDITIEPNNN